MIGTERGTVRGGGCTSNCENTCVIISSIALISYLINMNRNVPVPVPVPVTVPVPVQLIHSRYSNT